MWDRRKLLLAAIVFTALYCKVTVESAKLLDMAPDAVDDTYSGCREKAMQKFIHSGLLQREQSTSEGFQRAWNANTQCSKVIPGGIKEHVAALSAYVNADLAFRQAFDNAVETLGANVSTYEDHFHFKSLHFLLMDSITLTNPKKCKTLYALSDKKYTATKGSTVRLGRFTVVHSNYSELKKWEDFHGQVFFNISSCSFVNLGANVCKNDEDKVLLSPAEVFTVEEVNDRTDDNDAEYKEIILKHSKLGSSHNCYIFSRSPADVSTQWFVLVLVAFSLFFFNC